MSEAFSMANHHPRVDILGVGVSAINMDDALQTLVNWVRDGQREYVCVSNTHVIMESYHNPALRAVCNAAGMVTPDGMPLVWLCRLGGQRHTRRVYGPDLLLAVCAAPQTRALRHFFYGSAAGVAEKLAADLRQRFPHIDIVGTYAPPFRDLTTAETQAVIRRLNDAQPDIIWVGLGAPKQEFWMARMRPHLQAPVLIGVGAAFDFHSGNKRQAPRWMQRSGLEWVFRLMQEPRRLWRRYLPDNFIFVALVLRQKLGQRMNVRG